MRQINFKLTATMIYPVKPSIHHNNNVHVILNCRQMLRHDKTGNGDLPPQMFYFNTAFLQVVSAAAAVTPAFSVVLFQLFFTVCLNQHVTEMCPHTHTLLRGSLAPLPRLVISTWFGGLLQRDRRLPSHLRLDQRLSAVSYLQVVGGNCRWTP